MEPKSKAFGVKKPPDSQFGLGVGPTDGGHVAAASFWSEAVGHGLLGGFQPCGRNLANGSDVICKGDPDHVELWRIRVAPNVFTRAHDDLTDTIREQVLGRLCGKRCQASRADKLHSSALDDFFPLHGFDVQYLGTLCNAKGVKTLVSPQSAFYGFCVSKRITAPTNATS